MLGRLLKACIVPIIACGVSTAHAQTDPCLDPLQGAQQNVRIGEDSGGKKIFRLNSQPWMPRGLQIRGFVASIATARWLEDTQSQGQATIDAQGIYAEPELAAAWQVFNANMLRFQVSQHDLDAADDRTDDAYPEPMPAYSAAYKSKLLDALELARSKCFVVIISMQAQKRSGVIARKTIPSLGTRRAWSNLLSGTRGAALMADRGVMLEIYNEPGGPDQVPDLDAWRDWAHASQTTPAHQGSIQNPDNQVFGMQPMINFLRDMGSDNVLIVDGLKIADTFAGVDALENPLQDPLNAQHDQLVYAVHPYLRGETGNGDSVWQGRFGFLKTASTQNSRPAVPVLVTEWGAHEGDTGLGMGIPPDPSDWTPAVNLLNYLIGQKIPVSAGAMDINSIMSQQPGSSSPTAWIPTNYDNYDQNACPQSYNNAGLLVANMFKTTYSRPLVLADGVTPTQNTQIWCP